VLELAVGDRREPTLDLTPSRTVRNSFRRRATHVTLLLLGLLLELRHIQ